MFKCEECGTNLHLLVTDGHYTSYQFNDDGSLEYVDSDGTGEEMYLECYECSSKYEFDTHLMTVTEVPKLDWFGKGKLDLADVGIKRRSDY